MQNVDTIKSAAESMPDWTWLKNHAGNMAQLEELTNAAKAAKTQFMDRMMTEEHKEVKKGKTSHELISEFKVISKRTARDGVPSCFSCCFPPPYHAPTPPPPRPPQNHNKFGVLLRMPGPVDKLNIWHSKVMQSHAVEKRFMQSLVNDGNL